MTCYQTLYGGANFVPTGDHQHEAGKRHARATLKRPHVAKRVWSVRSCGKQWRRPAMRPRSRRTLDGSDDVGPLFPSGNDICLGVNNEANTKFFFLTPKQMTLLKGYEAVSLGR